MPTIADAYDQWADQYDTNQNKTRDLEGHALRTLLDSLERPLASVLEIGCGTGKNSEWLVTRAQQVVGVDFSLEMLARAQAKVQAENIRFEFADITEPWEFTDQKFDLITFSLVLEHVEDLRFVFAQTLAHAKPGGLVYVGELHPFKQYQGSQARFDTPAGRVEVPVFQHHVAEFTQLAKAAGLYLLDLREWFDEDAPAGPPRILTLLFQRMQVVS
ncbi:class I SAM-dependent methyltransferase [Hymenobacter caeli]|uniref:Ubiquinone/menaquinone biosynthesis C-methylase UbiE n=1 Tax=Hymenobacter caeli TaxID=2735894 RepID=A0ABX2FK32_9BACT|nr:class I SAM-dependent methyltransferase [Hymenobacter caeli]NRT17472.1 ubiquinone/menaquinone biosynthesis C-methylase UbiE [Hymenobacter caeli]